MARQRYDIASKWLLHNCGKDTLRLGGLKVERTEPMPGEVVQSRRLPDGLLQAYLPGEPEPCHVLIEIATYPEQRALKQALDDLTLAYSALGHLPDLLFLVLRPKGKFHIGDEHTVRAKLGLSQLAVRWRTVELWTLPAESCLAEADVGMLPWVPLMHMARPPEVVIERCVDRIEKEAPKEQEGQMLAVTEVMTGLRFPDFGMFALFEGKTTMIKSPVYGRWKAMGMHDSIIAVLENRFKKVPREVAKVLRGVFDQQRLLALIGVAGRCSDLNEFREALKG